MQVYHEVEFQATDDCPLECRAVPADDAVTTFPGDAETIAELLNGSDHDVEPLPRYEARLAGYACSPADGYEVFDRQGRRVVCRFDSYRDALDHAVDLNSEDWPECPDWTRTAPPSELFDVPVRLAPVVSQARPDRTRDESYPTF